MSLTKPKTRIVWAFISHIHSSSCKGSFWAHGVGQVSDRPYIQPAGCWHQPVLLSFNWSISCGVLKNDWYILGTPQFQPVMFQTPTGFFSNSTSTFATTLRFLLVIHRSLMSSGIFYFVSFIIVELWAAGPLHMTNNIPIDMFYFFICRVYSNLLGPFSAGSVTHSSTQQVVIDLFGSPTCSMFICSVFLNWTGCTL